MPDTRAPAPGTSVRAVAGLVALGALLLGLGTLVAVTGPDDPAPVAGQGTDDTWRGAVLDPARPRPAFTLTDTEGRPYDFAAETQGRLTLLFFGYTSCPDVCPVHMATLSAALDQPGMP